MANIVLTRIDYRLIHGQVITKWRKVFTIAKIIVINNELSKDTFMTNIYISAAPADMKVKVYDEDKAVRVWERNQYGEGQVMLLFRDMQSCERIIKRGVKIPAVQLGGLPKGMNKKMITPAVSFDKEDMDSATNIHGLGIPVYVQMTPDQGKLGYEEIVSIFNK